METVLDADELLRRLSLAVKRHGELKEQLARAEFQRDAALEGWRIVGEQLAALQWSEISESNLPKLGDEVACFVDDGVVVYEVTSSHTLFTYRKWVDERGRERGRVMPHPRTVNRLRRSRYVERYSLSKWRVEHWTPAFLDQLDACADDDARTILMRATWEHLTENAISECGC